jgi:hypothetical protein
MSEGVKYQDHFSEAQVVGTKDVLHLNMALKEQREGRRKKGNGDITTACAKRKSVNDAAHCACSTVHHRSAAGDDRSSPAFSFTRSSSLSTY